MRRKAPSTRQLPDAGEIAAAAVDTVRSPKKKTGAEAPVGSNEGSSPNQNE